MSISIENPKNAQGSNHKSLINELNVCLASVAEPFLQKLSWHLVFLIVKYSVKITGFTFEMLLKYLTQSKIRLIVKAPVVILSVLRKTCNVLLTFVLAVHANCRLYSLKQKLLQSIMCSFLPKLCLVNFVLVFRAAVLF